MLPGRASEPLRSSVMARKHSLPRVSFYTSFFPPPHRLVSCVKQLVWTCGSWDLGSWHHQFGETPGLRCPGDARGLQSNTVGHDRRVICFSNSHFSSFLSFFCVLSGFPYLAFALSASDTFQDISGILFSARSFVSLSGYKKVETSLGLEESQQFAVGLQNQGKFVQRLLCLTVGCFRSCCHELHMTALEVPFLFPLHEHIKTFTPV